MIKNRLILIAMPRFLIILLVASVALFLFIAKCLISLDALTFEPQTDITYLRIKEVQCLQETVTLKKKLLILESELYMEQLRHNQTKTLIEELKQKLNHVTYNENYIEEKVHQSEIVDGLPMKTEYDIPPFNRFTVNKIYLVDPGLGKRVVEKPIAFKKRDLYEIINYGLQNLNNDRVNGSPTYSVEHFLEGMYRTTPSIGSQYELYFRYLTPKEQQLSSINKMSIVRPFASPRLIRHQVQDTSKQWINIIIPLSGRINKFNRFMNRFIKTCIKTNALVYLTVVYFGDLGFDEVKSILTKISKRYSYNNMKLVTVNEKFSRGRGLQIGVTNWKGGDVLMFFCDVDIVFGLDFLERCRLNTERSRRVYYPIVFSLYNPNVVYKLHGMQIPPENDQLIISKETGFWRDFGYGMTCQYRSDFLNIRGFENNSSEWGGEDVSLYQKYVKSKFLLIRVTDPGIFHLWHEKVCNKNMTSEKYHSCIRSKALNEASHAQLGVLAFKDEISNKS